MYKFFHFIGMELRLPCNHVQFVCGAATAVSTRGRTSLPPGNRPWQDCWLVQELYWLMASINIRLEEDKIYEEFDFICCVRAKFYCCTTKQKCDNITLIVTSCDGYLYIHTKHLRKQ